MLELSYTGIFVERYMERLIVHKELALTTCQIIHCSRYFYHSLFSLLLSFITLVTSIINYSRYFYHSLFSLLLSFIILVTSIIHYSRYFYHSLFSLLLYTYIK